MTSKILYLTRHSQAEHNVASDWSIPDAPLTKLGRQQSEKLNKETNGTIQEEAELLVCSPLRRTMSTMLLGYPKLRQRLEQKGKPAILLPELQEVNSLPCDTGSDVSALQNDEEFKALDFSDIKPDWNSKKGIYDPRNVKLRAQKVRKWLRDRPEQKIAVVAHGDILRNIVQGRFPEISWNNAEVKLYTFASDDDDEAKLVEYKQGPRVGGNEPTSEEASKL